MTLETNRIKAIFFDIDGTLADTDDYWVQSFSHRFKPFERFLGAEGMTRIFRWLVMVGETPGNFLYAFLDSLHLDDDLYRFANKITSRKKKKGIFPVIQGVPEMLFSLSGKFTLGVVSARNAETTDHFLETNDLKHFFKVVVTAETCLRTKPMPDPVLWAAKECGIPAEYCLMVGDTTVDMLAGKRAGTQTVGVLCGFGTKRELRYAGADLIIENTTGLPHILRGDQL